jgi:voltage-dependent calcium channel alpha-2/delta-3
VKFKLIALFSLQRRVTRQTRDLYYRGIDDTPFTLVISIPTQFGKYRLQTRSEDEIHRDSVKGTNVLNFFSGPRWKIHPDW